MRGVFLLRWPFTLGSVKTYQGRFGVHMERFQEIHPHPNPLPSRERGHPRCGEGYAKISQGRASNMRDCSRICAKPTSHADTGGFHEGEGTSNSAAWMLVSRVVAESRPRHVNLGAVAIAMNGVRQKG